MRVNEGGRRLKTNTLHNEVQQQVHTADGSVEIAVLYQLHMQEIVCVCVCVCVCLCVNTIPTPDLVCLMGGIMKQQTTRTARGRSKDLPQRIDRT